MKFLIDAQLPRRLALFLRQVGHEAIHTLELPDGNRTPDTALETISQREQAVLVTKDTDFIYKVVLGQGAYKLLLVRTGNVSNDVLLSIFTRYLDDLVSALEQHTFVELTSDYLITHW